KVLKKTASVGSCESFHTMRLSLLDGVARDGAVRAKPLGLFLHLAMPHIFVELTDIQEDTHLGNRLKLGGAWLPHVSRERGNGTEVLRIRCCNVHCRNSAVRRTGEVELVVLDFVVREDLLQKLRENAVSAFKEEIPVWSGRSDHEITALFRLGPQV